MHSLRNWAAVFLLLLSAIIAGPCDAGTESQNSQSLAPYQTAIGLQTGFRSGALGAGLDINASYLLTNVGINARTWNNQSHNDSVKNELSIYGGIGLVDVFQLQLGYSSANEFLLRMRSDVPLTPTREAWEQFNRGKYWIITPVIEIPLSAHKAMVLGLGVGRSF
jgi:hypothetical protein